MNGGQWTIDNGRWTASGQVNQAGTILKSIASVLCMLRLVAVIIHSFPNVHLIRGADNMISIRAFQAVIWYIWQRKVSR